MDDPPPSARHSRRNSHFEEQRASLSLSQSRAHSGDGAGHDNLSPLQSPRRASTTDDELRSRRRSNNSDTGRSSRHSRRRSATAAAPVDEYTLPAEWEDLDEVAAPPPVVRPAQDRLHQQDSLERELESSRRSGRRGGRRPPGGRETSYEPVGFEDEQDLSDLSAAPPAIPRSREKSAKSRANRPSGHGRNGIVPATPAAPHLPSGSSSSAANGKPLPPQERASEFATELYTISYLIIFSILGTLARLGLQWLTFYPGAPVVFSELWANVAGSLIMGFLSEDRQLFGRGWATSVTYPSGRPRKVDEERQAQAFADAKASHDKVKKAIPLYIGLATGFCGSFTSFSAFIRDVFLALSNDLPTPLDHPYPSSAPRPSFGSTVHRNGGYSFMAILAVIIITVALCMAALHFGAHLALALDSLTPAIPFSLTRRLLDRATVPIAWLAWLGAVFMCIWPPDRPGGPLARPGGWASETWRGQALFACVFAPLGCLLRFHVSLKLNGMVPGFPLGTFTVNVFGTAVLGMAYDLQHLRLSGDGGVGGGRVGCQVLEGVMAGFCGSLTTVSTWALELGSLRRKHAYGYGMVSVAVGLGVLVVIMGSVRWTVGFKAPGCVTT